MPKRIVIVGAGFGGVYALKSLHRTLHGRKGSVRLTVINPANYFLFTPLLHEVATGGIEPENVVEPLRRVLGCCLNELILDEVQKIDLEARAVYLKKTRRAVAYDHLILSTGAKTEYYGVPGAAENTFGLKSLTDAYHLKNHIIQTVENAFLLSPEKRKKELTFAVVGGGPTGVELAAEIAEFLEGTFARFYKELLAEDKPRIVILERGEGILTQMPPRLREKALASLRQKGVEVRLSMAVKEIRRSCVYIESGETLEAATIVWTAGVRPSLPAINGTVDINTKGRLAVDASLRLPAYPEVFVLGDVAAVDAEKLPTTAQVAVKAGRAAGRNLSLILRGKPTRHFRYRHKGDLVSLGRWQAVAEIYGLNFSGRFAWWLWRTVYLFKMLSWSKKAKVALDWTINSFAPRDISQL